MNEIYKSNCNGEFEVLKDLGNSKRLVRFLETGYTTEAYISNIRKGKVKDHSVKYEQPIEKMNLVLPSLNSGDFRVIRKQGRKYDIVFLETGTTKRVDIGNAVKGTVKDPYRKSAYGVGVFGEIKNKPKWFKQAHQLWRNMLKRCYYKGETRGYYGKAFVSLRWHYFPNFIEDLPSLEGFDKWLEGYNGGEKYNLDKDTIVEGNMYYGKDLCRFLPESVNKSFTSRSKTVGQKRLDEYLKTT